MAKYRGAVIGLGWMGMLYDLAERPGPALDQPRFDLQSGDRPTPDLDVHRRFQQHEAHLRSGRPTSYAEAMADRSDVELVAAADRDVSRLNTFTERYGAESVYTDAMAMLEEVKPDLVAVATNIRGRADLTVAAVENGAKGIVTEKPMANTLDEADRMVGACAEAGVPLSCGAISTTHPSFATAKELMNVGRNRRGGVDRSAEAGLAAPELGLLPGGRPRVGDRHRATRHGTRAAATSSKGRG